MNEKQRDSSPDKDASLPEAPRPLASSVTHDVESDVQRWVEQCGTQPIERIEDKPWVKELVEKIASDLPLNKSNLANELPSLKAIGDYRLLKKIGVGGMGTVWLAEQEQPIRRQVAIKLLSPGMERHGRRFASERQVLAMMDHPNIARLYESGETSEGQPYLVMEYVAGQDIATFADAHELSLDKRLHLFLEVCEAIQHSHGHGIIHRDIKPANILASWVTPHSSSNAVPVVKVIDFGLAKTGVVDETNHWRLRWDQSQTAERTILGSPLWMSPEQARLALHARSDSDSVDVRSDVYSLGAVLYQLLTGTTPLDQKKLETSSSLELIEAICELSPLRPSARQATVGGGEADRAGQVAFPKTASLVGRIDRDLDWVVLRALEIEPGRRYATVEAFVDDLRRYVAGRPVVAGSPSLVYRLKKTIRRNRTAVLTSAFILAAIGLSAWFAIAFARHAQDADSRARVANNRASQQAAEAEQAKRKVGEVRANEASIRKDLERIDALFKVSLDRLSPAHEEFRASKRDAPFLRDVESMLDDIGLVSRIRFNLLNKISSIWFTYGEYEESQRILEAAIEGYRSKQTVSPLPFLQEHSVAKRMLGSVYIEIGRQKEGLSLIQSSFQSLQKHASPVEEDTVRTRVTLAGAFVRNGQHQNAIKVCREGIELLASHQIAGTMSNLDLANILATALSNDGQYAEAIEVCEKAMVLDYDDVPEEVVRIISGHSVARVYRKTQNHSEGLELTRELYEKSKMRFGPDHPRTLELLKDKGIFEFSTGNRQGGIDTVGIALKRAKGRYADGRQITLEISSDLGYLMVSNQQWSDAIEHLQYSYDGKTKLLGASHPSTLLTMINLGTTLVLNGKPAEAETILADAYRRSLEDHGPSEPTTYQAMVSLATFCFARGDEAGGLRMARSFVDTCEREKGAGNNFTLQGKTFLASAYFQMGMNSECQSTCTDVIEQPESLMGESRMKCLLTSLDLALSGFDFESIEQQIDQSWVKELLEKPENKVYQLRLELLRAEVDVHKQRFESAKKRLVTIQRSMKLDPVGRSRSQSLYGYCLLNEGDLVKAEPFLVAGYRGCYLGTAGLQRNIWFLIPAADRLVELYALKGKTETRNQWKQTVEQLRERHANSLARASLLVDSLVD